MMNREKRKKFYSAATEVCGNVTKAALVGGVITFFIGAIFAYGQDVIENKERKERFNNNNKNKKQ